ncbi:MAG: molybdopterin-dependent oxidoreductase [Deltaproteobacteria bacterium]|nr:molybdopterin-dependent oxidoreductase [Deltaproteobacteria bacterium]
MTLKKVVCMQCHNACRLAARVEGGRLVSVEPDQDFPGTKSSYAITKGCPRRRHVIEYFYHPGRLNYPLKRAGNRGENKWQEISWEDAIGEIGRRMEDIIQKHGPEAIATTSGTGRTHDEIRQRFFNLLGSPNHTGAGQICYGPFCVMSNVVLGWRLFPVVRKQTRCILFWGGGGPRYWDIFWRSALKAQEKRGAKIIVIDARGTDAARRADLWLQIRPGTDCALALGMINHILENELYDKSFVKKWCHGFEQLRERASAYPIEKVSEITWLPAPKIRQAAEWYATLKPGVTNHGMGVEHLQNSIETLHALFSLVALCGNVDVEGGDVFTTPYPGIIHEQEIAAHHRLPEEQIQKTLGLENFRLMSRKGYDLIQSSVRKVWGNLVFNRTSYEVFAHGPSIYRAILTGKPYPVRGMITLSSNPMVTAPNTRLVHRALKSLDLYVVVDFFMTPSAQLADFVLPSTTYLERPWLWTYSGVVGSERALPRTVDGAYDRRDDYDFWRSLGIQLGQGEDWPWETLEDLYDYRLKPAGLTFREFMNQGGFLAGPKEFKRYETAGFGTPSGKIELYSKILEELGYDPLPRFYEPSLSPYSRPELAKEYPFILITGGRHQPFYHSEHRQNPSLRKMHPEPVFQIHPEAGRKLRIKEGDWAWIETPKGIITQRCKYLETMHPQVVHVQHGWWYPEEEGAESSLYGVWKSNCNVLIDDEPSLCNPISGGWPLRGLLCKVHKK